MNKLTKEIAETLIGKYIATKTENSPEEKVERGKDYSEQAGYVHSIEKDGEGHWWLVYDWGWGVRIDAIVDYWEETPI